MESAVEHQRLDLRDLTSFYLVNLLTRFVHPDRTASIDEPLGLRFARSLQSAGSRQRDGLREVGDLSLFTSGFFADSLNRGYVAIDYYIRLGEYSYARSHGRNAPSAMSSTNSPRSSPRASAC